MKNPKIKVVTSLIMCLFSITNNYGQLFNNFGYYSMNSKLMSRMNVYKANTKEKAPFMLKEGSDEETSYHINIDDYTKYKDAIRYFEIQDSLWNPRAITLLPSLNGDHVTAQVELASGWIDICKVTFLTNIPLTNDNTPKTAEDYAQKLAANGGSFNINAYLPVLMGWDPRIYRYSLGPVARTGFDVPAIGGFTNKLNGYAQMGIEGMFGVFSSNERLAISSNLRINAVVANKDYRPIFGFDNNNWHAVVQGGFNFSFLTRYNVSLIWNTYNRNHSISGAENWNKIRPVIGFTALIGS